MLEQLIAFFSFSDINIRYVTIGTLLIGISTAIVGCFTFLRKRALVGDAIAHSVLPGVCLGFLLFDSKNPLVLLGGAFVSGWIAIILIDYITAQSRIKSDTAIGLVLSVFFGVGILMLTAIQHSGNAAQSGLDKFLFGKAASIIEDDLYVLSIVCIILIFTVIIFFRQFMLISFDRAYAKSIGLRVTSLEILLSTITVLAIATGIQAVGVVLMAALLITPATAARFWTDRLWLMVLLAAIIGGVSGVAGAFVSYTAPAMPTGPWIVAIVSIIALLSILLAPGKGYLFRKIRLRKHQNKVLEENILKLFYHLGEQERNFLEARNIKELQNRRFITKKNLEKGIKRLIKKSFIQRDKSEWKLTESGKLEGQRIVRIHRLWEMYLSTYLKMAPDHVHDDADAIEHIITPELEQMLATELGFPSKDPHDKDIPYPKRVH